MGEFLLDTQGNVVKVWTIREVRLIPPFPPLNQAIVDAIRQWQFRTSYTRRSNGASMHDSYDDHRLAVSISTAV
jgi:hypothetical protein